MKKQKVVSGSNYQTAGQPFQTEGKGAVIGEVETTREDRPEDRMTATVVPSAREDASPARRKLRPMWVIIPAIIALAVLAFIWGGTYLIEILGGVQGK